MSRQEQGPVTELHCDLVEVHPTIERSTVPWGVAWGKNLPIGAIQELRE